MLPSAGSGVAGVTCSITFIALNERHLKRLLSEYLRYYHQDRTHLGLGKQTPGGRTPSGPWLHRSSATTRRSAPPLRPRGLKGAELREHLQVRYERFVAFGNRMPARGRSTCAMRNQYAPRPENFSNHDLSKWFCIMASHRISKQ